MGFIIRNLLLKNERAEDMIISYQEYLTQVDEIIKNSDKKLQEIDAKGTFKSDDEIGWFFDKIKLLQEVLNQYKLKNL
jgi:hypothetical protein